LKKPEASGGCRPAAQRPGATPAATIAVDELAVPGDFGSKTTTITGQFHVTAGPGAPVLVGSGRAVFAPDGTTVSQSGQMGLLDLLANEPSAVQAVCAALGG
jgi:hypothetical protein